MPCQPLGIEGARGNARQEVRYSDYKKPLGMSPVLPTPVSRRLAVMEEHTQRLEAQHSIQSAGEDHVGRIMWCWCLKLGGFDGEPNEDGWAERGQDLPKQQLNIQESLCVCGGGDPDRCLRASRGRLLQTEAKWI